jgi:hypothetical protein
MTEDFCFDKEITEAKNRNHGKCFRVRTPIMVSVTVITVDSTVRLMFLGSGMMVQI